MKRIASKLLTLLLVLCALVLPAAAAGNANAGAEAPLLTARYYNRNAQKPFDNVALSSGDETNRLVVDNNQMVIFFYGDDPIPRSRLAASDKIDIAAVEDVTIPSEYRDCVCNLRIGDFDGGKIRYVGDGINQTVAELSVTGALPFIGLFKTEAYSEDSYIWNDTDMASLPDTVYLLGEDAVHITDVSVEQGQNLLTAEAPKDTSEAWKIHLNKDVGTSGWLNLRVTYTENWDEPQTSREYRVGFNWRNTTPHLYLRDWGGSIWEYPPDTLNYGDTLCADICFGSGDTSDPVLTVSQLKSENGSIVFEQQENGLSFSVEYKKGDTEDAIVYEAPDGKSYRMAFKLGLPVLGVYRDTSWSAASLVGTMEQSFDQGTTPELYLHWTCDTNELKDIYASGMDGGMEFEITNLLDKRTYPALYGVTFTPNEDENYVKFVPMITSYNQYQFRLDFKNGSGFGISFSSHSSLYDPTPLPVVTIQGVEYTFGLGEPDFGGETMIQYGSGSTFGSFDTAEMPCDFDQDALLAIFANSDTSERAEAPAWLYDCVKDVSFTLTSISNMDASGVSSVPGPGEAANITMEQMPNLELRGRSIPRVHLHADAGKFFSARLELKFTLDLTAYGLGEQTYTVSNGAHYTRSGEAHFAIDEKMTAAELNEALSTTENLLAFLQKTDSEAYTAYRRSTANSFTGDYSIILDLPAVAYDEPIIVAADHPSSMLLCLNGSVDQDGAPQTRMCGLYLNGASLFHLSGIAFDPKYAADPSKLLRYNDKTCALLSTSYPASEDENRRIPPRLADLGKMSDCWFSGFGYGAVSMESSYFSPPDRCTFRNCGVGLYYDCKEKTIGLYGSYSGTENTFAHCGTAILIESLPMSGDMFSPYMFRFYDNTFIHDDPNALDFDVRVSGKFYFYRNAYNDSENDALLKYRPVQLKTSNGAIVITNPCRLPDGTLFVQAGQYAEIISSMSDQLVISGASDVVDVDVVGEDDQLIGTWTLHPKEEVK